MVRQVGRVVLRPCRWLGAALLGAEATLAVLVLVWPHAPDDYRAVYMDGERDCWLPDGLPPPALPSGDVIRPGELPPRVACALLPHGWNPADGWGVWSNGPAARLDIPLRGGDRRVTLRLRGYSPGVAQFVTWEAAGNGGHGALLIPPGTEAELPITVPPAVVQVGRLQVVLRPLHVHAPTDTEISDWRAIGVALLAVERSG